MYGTLLVLHNLLRWVVLLLALAAVFQAWRGWLASRAVTPGARKLNTAFIASLDVQVLLGFILYLVASPTTRAAFADFGSAMGNRTLRFWAVEHMALMLVALLLAHFGSVFLKRGTDDRRRWRKTAILFSLALVAMLAAIPWPGLSYGRPLLRF